MKNVTLWANYPASLIFSLKLNSSVQDFRFSQWGCWQFTSSGILCNIQWQRVIDISQAIQSFEMSVTTYHSMWYNTVEDLIFKLTSVLIVLSSWLWQTAEAAVLSEGSWDGSRCESMTLVILSVVMRCLPQTE